jgi:hypothetical protein
MFPVGGRARNSGCQEVLTMSDQASTPGGSGDEQREEPDELDDAREAELLRDLLRVQEQHREGGVEPELDGAEADPEAGT